MTRLQVMKQWGEGFAAAFLPCGFDDSKPEHWQAGYLAGYKMRPEKNRALDEYLISTGRKPQAVIKLANNERTPNVREQEATGMERIQRPSETIGHGSEGETGRQSREGQGEENQKTE